MGPKQDCPNSFYISAAGCLVAAQMWHNLFMLCSVTPEDSATYRRSPRNICSCQILSSSYFLSCVRTCRVFYRHKMCKGSFNMDIYFYRENKDSIIFINIPPPLMHYQPTQTQKTRKETLLKVYYQGFYHAAGSYSITLLS